MGPRLTPHPVHPYSPLFPHPPESVSSPLHEKLELDPVWAVWAAQMSQNHQFLPHNTEQLEVGPCPGIQVEPTAQEG